MTVLEDIAVLATPVAGDPPNTVRETPDAALVWEGDTIRWVGPRAALPAAFARAHRVSAGGRLVVPGLVDAHTHLCFGGWRADEFAKRLRGADYRAVARRGGGIAATMHATRAASEADLAARGAGFLAAMRRLGVTTAEVKSGYGLSLEHELAALRAYRRLAAAQPTRLVPTCLAAHIVPPEFASDRAAYVRLLTDALLPAVAAEGLARYADVFVEETAFSPDEARAILDAAARLGLGAKLHVDQLGEGGGAELAVALGAASADHLERVSAAGIRALAASATVAVTLPIAALYLGTPFAPGRALVDAGAAVAVATDFNPGSAPSYDLHLALLLACTRQRMTPAEALAGATLVAARAIGMAAEVGSLEPGKKADLAVLDAPDLGFWLYHYRPGTCVRTVIGGQTVWQAPAEPYVP
ncbi:MAG: imidazolonepropionase [Rubricoccaceae bacterium]